MILAIYYDSTRNVMGDLYKNIVNEFAGKENVIVVVPSAYEISEFSSSFHTLLKENVSCEDNRFIRIFKMLRFTLKITQYIKRYNVSRVYFQIDQFLYDFLILLFNRKLKSTIWIHDVIIHDGEGNVAKIKKRIMKNILYPKFSRIIVSYHKAKKDFFACLGDMYNNVDVVYLPRLKELEYPKLLEENTIEYDYIFYGRIEKYKGLDLLIKAMDDESMNDIKLLIVGRGREDKKIWENIKGKENIKFVNEYVPNEELARLITKSRYVILPYISATGTQTIQLANYYGKPVIATKVGCFEEYIDEGVNGFFIEEINYLSIRKKMKMINKIRIDKDKIATKLEEFDLKITSKKIQNIICENRVD